MDRDLDQLTTIVYIATCAGLSYGLARGIGAEWWTYPRMYLLCATVWGVACAVKRLACHAGEILEE